MRPIEVARRLDVTGQTIRRWTREYREFMSPSAKPAPGASRTLSDTDVRVLAYIAHLRNENRDPDYVKERLRQSREKNYDDLPPIPPEWHQEPIEADRAMSIARLAAENTQLTARLENALENLEESRAKVAALEARNAELATSAETTKEQLTAARLELSEARGEVGKLEAHLSSTVPRAELARLEGELTQYRFGRDKPVSVAVIVLVTALGVVLMMLAVVLVLSAAL